MPRHKAGTLVQVKEWALTKKCSFVVQNTALVRDHGYLWFVEKWNSADEHYSCRSFATGEPDVTFYAEEIRGQRKKDIINA